MKVYFLRHGIAAGKSAWKGKDELRPLAAEGISQMKRVAETLGRLDLGVQAILTSPLTRAQQTAEIVAKGLRKSSSVQIERRLAPGFNAKKLRQIVRKHAKSTAIMLVGHEPDFSKTISDVIGGGRVVCKKGGVALVQLRGERRRGDLLWLVPSEVLERTSR